MGFRNIRVGSLLGIPILINPSWFILLGLSTWLLATRIFPEMLEDASTLTYVLMALTSVILFFWSIVLHELAHSVVARWYRIPVKSITLFVLGGVAHITQEAKKPLAELFMAAAGPFSSLLIGIAFIAAWYVLGGRDPGGADARALDLVLLWLGLTNGMLAVFNMIPAYPMDGGRVFRSLIWLVTGNHSVSTQIAAWTGRGFAWLLIALGILAALDVDVYVAEPGFGALWLVFLGFFLENAARQGLMQSRYVRALDQYRAGELMLTNPPTVDPEMSVASLARGVLEINPRVCYAVEAEGRLAGIVSAYQLRAVPEALWDRMTAREAMVPSSQLQAVAPDRLVSEILLEMENRDLTHLPVVREGHVVGIIGRDRILGVLKQAGLIRGM
ncbi:MAG: site-2 protease family protein [Dehalococcoidia bacterium]|nr:site-2 protease family protein [Dehalococcoidia bacterium]